jgi:hypothetical protein
MDLTAETVLKMAKELVGIELSPDEAEAILPYVRSNLETARELEGLGLEGEDPREMDFIEDGRVVP